MAVKDNNQSLIYTFDTYENSGIDIEKARFVDGITTAGVLPFHFKSISRFNSFDTLERYSITELKNAMGLSSVGENKLGRRSQYIAKNLSHIKRVIDFHDEQVVRMLLEHPNCIPEELLLYKIEDRIELVDQQRLEIFEHVFFNERSYIWGSISDSNAVAIGKGLSLSVNNHKRCEFNDIFARYTTIAEAETGIVKTKAHKRFYNEK